MPSRHAADIRQVATKTGRTPDEWCELLESNGIGERREAVNFLRDAHAVSHAFALTIADHCLRRAQWEDEDGYGEWGEDEEEERW
jgi:Domain of unknown function (DUF4287)